MLSVFHSISPSNDNVGQHSVPLTGYIVAKKEHWGLDDEKDRGNHPSFEKHYPPNPPHSVAQTEKLEHLASVGDG
jgi:hypothetical protein